MSTFPDLPSSATALRGILAEKYVARTGLPGKADGLRSDVVFTNGVFDILHAGHLDYLSRAAKLADKLWIGVNSDASVKRLKGDGRPVNNLAARLAHLACLSFVAHVTEFDEDTPLNLIGQIHPGVYVKGGDYSRADLPEVPLVEGYGGRVEILPFLEDHSTTSIIEKIRKKEP